MKICPKCRNEYREGITHCADCGCELINENEEAAKKALLLEAEYPRAKKVLEYLEYCKFATITADEPDENGVMRIFCEEKELKNAYKQVQVFINEEKQTEMNEEFSEMSEQEFQDFLEEVAATAPPSSVYQNYEEKAEEHKSSAFSFLIIGAIGLAIVVLSWFDLLPFSIGGSGNLFTHGVLFVFFVIFIFVGIVSAKSVGKYKELATKEASDQTELEKYMAEKFSYEVLSAITADTEEEAYFKRIAYMREQVAADMPEAAKNGSFIESHLDEYYDKIFG